MSELSSRQTSLGSEDAEYVSRQVTALKRLAFGFGSASVGSVGATVEVIRNDYAIALGFGGLALGGTAVLVYSAVDMARHYAINDLNSRPPTE